MRSEAERRHLSLLGPRTRREYLIVVAGATPGQLMVLSGVPAKAEQT